MNRSREWVKIYDSDRWVHDFQRCKGCGNGMDIRFRGVEKDDPRQKMGYDLYEYKCPLCEQVWTRYSLWD